MAESISILVADDHPHCFAKAWCIPSPRKRISKSSARPSLRRGRAAPGMRPGSRRRVARYHDARLGRDCHRRKITTACPATKVMMLTVMEDESKLLASFKAGARAYVLKGISANELARVVRSVAQGEVYVTPSLAAGILVALTRAPAPQDPLEGLTERESEVLKLVVQGLTNREIGDRLHLSEKTIKHYITNILEKAACAQPHGGGDAGGAR